MDATIRCVCPPKADGPRHDQDTITFRDRLDFRQALTMRKAIALAKADDPDISAAEILALLTEHYLLEGIEAWTLVDAKGKGVEPSKAAIRDFLADHPEEAMAAGDEADELYGPVILLPLLARATGNSTSSPGTPTTPSTSQRTGSPRKRPKNSKPSSTSTTRTDGTATITSLHGGDSSSSQTSASAA